MRLERRHGWLLAGIAAWNVVIWLTFAKNLAHQHAIGADEPTGYYPAHIVLIVVDLLISVVLARLAWQLLRRPSDAPDASGRGGGRRGGPS